MISKRMILDWLKTESESCFGTEDVAAAALKEFKLLRNIESRAKAVLSKQTAEGLDLALDELASAVKGGRK